MNLDPESSERLALLRFPLIVGVVFIHAYGAAVAFDNGATVVGAAQAAPAARFVQDLVSQGLARIAVPLFFWMSGYFFFLGFTGTWAEYRAKLRARVKTLLIPFLFWNAATLLVFAVVQALPATRGMFASATRLVRDYSGYDFCAALLGFTRFPAAYQFWFIRDLMVMVLLAPVLQLLLRYLPRISVVALLGLWFCDAWPLAIPSAAAVAFFHAGAWSARAGFRPAALDRFAVPVAAAYAVLVLLDTYGSCRDWSDALHPAGVLLGVAAALALSGPLARSDRLKKGLLAAGSCSFFVFAVHEPLLTVFKKTAYLIFRPESGAAVLALYFLVPAVVVAVALLAHAVLRRLAPRLLAVVAGGRT